MLARGAEPKKTARVEEDIACGAGLFHSSNLTKVFAVAAIDGASDPRFISDERDRLRTCVGTLGIGRFHRRDRFANAACRGGLLLTFRCLHRRVWPYPSGSLVGALRWDLPSVLDLARKLHFRQQAQQ